MNNELLKAARHESAHAVIGFAEGMNFRDEGLSILAESSVKRLDLSFAAFVAPWNNPLGMVRVSLAGALYECLTYTGEVSASASQDLCGSCLYDSRNAALALGVWLRERDLTPDLPLRDLVFHSGSLSLRDWKNIEKHPESPTWSLVLEFHNRFIQSLCAVGATQPPLDGTQQTSTAALLQWLASETREVLCQRKNTIEALAMELLTQKRLKDDRYIMSGPDLESFLTAHQTNRAEMIFFFLIVAIIAGSGESRWSRVERVSWFRHARVSGVGLRNCNRGDFVDAESRLPR